jgi:NADH dehydrogenase
MILLTGATGVIGSALLAKLLAGGEPVRCLVRDPRRLGAQRVRVQIALGDLGDPGSFRNALRGVDTVVHLAAATRDQPRGSIEEIVTMATLRLVQAAQRAGVEHFVFFSVLGASAHHRVRLFRAKAIAERIVTEASVRSTVIAPSLVYAPDDRWLKLVERLAWLPAVPVPGSGRARCEPIWAQDVADCVVAVLGRQTDTSGRYELVGPQTLTYNQVLHTILKAAGRHRRLAHVPPGLAERALRAVELLAGEEAPVTWEEAELVRAECVSARGTADAQALGVEPQRMGLVLGLG